MAKPTNMRSSFLQLLQLLVLGLLLVLPSVEATSCSHQYQAQHTFSSSDNPLIMQYGIHEDEGSDALIFSARIIYEGMGYVSWGLSKDGRMKDAYAVVGLPDDNGGGSVDVHYMNGYSQKSFTNLNDQNLLLTTADSNSTSGAKVEQNSTHTILEFSTSSLVTTSPTIGPSIVVDGGETTNYFLVAVGSTNQFGFHAYRATVGLQVQVCSDQAEAGALEAEEVEEVIMEQPTAIEIQFDNKKTLFQWHGWLAALGWAILAPLAITSSLCRHLLPAKKKGLWFQIHFYSNIMVLVLTLVSFALVVKAIQDTEGSTNHFQPNTPANSGKMGQHRVIGLVVLVLVILQAIAGIVRPSTSAGTCRKLWEVTHRMTGFALLGMAYYQCHSGLILYGKRFLQQQESDNMDSYIIGFWIIACTITGIGFLGYLHKTFVHVDVNDDDDLCDDLDFASAREGPQREANTTKSSASKFTNDMTEDQTLYHTAVMGTRTRMKDQSTTGRLSSNSSNDSLDV